MTKKYLRGLIVAFSVASLPSLAADRSQNLKIDDYSMPLSQLAGVYFSEQDKPAALIPGDILGYDVYRKSHVIERDPRTGTVSLEVAGQTVSIRPDTREILAVTG